MDEFHWPNVERPLLDYLNASTRPTWTVSDPGSDPAALVAGLRVSGRGWAGETDKLVDAELTILAATRSEMWLLASEVEMAMRRLPDADTAGLDVDLVETAFDWKPEDPPATDVESATATYTLTIRPVEGAPDVVT